MLEEEKIALENPRTNARRKKKNVRKVHQFIATIQELKINSNLNQ